MNPAMVTNTTTEMFKMVKMLLNLVDFFTPRQRITVKIMLMANAQMSG